MRHKRAKAYRKLMALYAMTYGFRQPYQVLVDADMCSEATATKMDLVKHLGIVLQGTVKPMITQCCIVELYKLGKPAQEATDLAKTFERRKCNHREAIPGNECLESVVGPTNKHRYVIASQSQPLRAKLRAIPAVPLVHVSRSVMILEPPSDETLRQKEEAETKAMLPTATEVKQANTQDSTTDAPKKKKRKGPKGPNPLSVKKKKPKAQPSQPNAGSKANTGEKRKRDEGTAGDDSVERKRRRKEGEDVSSHS
ncbi:Fcf1-domain-containing protein [Exidia glandulosa HHB12029]|uniref:U three protein 23 n=1 Tax=Exidia glandulosa HHB12029 TaxID=1314781 RepID=A0A165PRU4_EXIGL|nr:Fcf1-domain-containing protein [Exidia glandulosa HHB12029]